MKAIFQLIRWKNLVLISLSQIFIIWGLYSLEHFTLPVIFYLICTFCFAAGGNIINDIFDIIPDKINKPNKLIVGFQLSIKQSYLTYYIFNAIGLVFVVYASILLNNYLFFAYGIPVLILLYQYSKRLKGVALVGNILIASFTSFSLFFFTLIIPSTTKQKTVIIVLSVFAFLINFIREIIKDIEDINGDRKANLNTLPILIGSKPSSKIAKTFTLITIVCLTSILFLSNNLVLKLYIFTALILPLSYIFTILKKANKKTDFTRVSKFLKLIILFGIFTILFIQT